MKIGIDLGGTKIEGILLGKTGEEIKRYRVATPSADGYSAIMQAILRMVNHLESIAGMACTVGVGTPGSVAENSQQLRNSNTTCLNNKPFKADLETILKRECRIENDANCFTLSEAIDGAGQNSNVVFGVIIGTGVGGGISVNKSLLTGRHHITGEWGHNVLFQNGAACYCGQQGCVETYLSGPGMIRNYTHHNSQQFNNARHLLECADSGDTKAIAVRSEYYRNFASALAQVINIIDPDIIVLGGGLSNYKPLYTEAVKHLPEYVFTDCFSTPICRNKHGDSSGVRGAAWLW